GWYNHHEYERLRGLYPYESMEELPPPRGSLVSLPLPGKAAKHLAALEEQIGFRGPDVYFTNRRMRLLYQLHEETVRLFVNQPGFGYSRMPGLSEWTLQAGLRDGPPLPQPGGRSTAVWSTESMVIQPRGPEEEPGHGQRTLFDLHEDSVVDFVHPVGFGYFKDRRHVAGFQAHQFSKVPEPAERWSLRTLDLVGLVLHDEPVVYISNDLPRM